MKRVLERVHFLTRPTMENGNQWVGMKEWSSDMVAIPPIIDRSSAVKPNCTLNFADLFRKTPIFLDPFYWENLNPKRKMATEWQMALQRLSIRSCGLRLITNLSCENNFWYNYWVKLWLTIDSCFWLSWIRIVNRIIILQK